jgi:hypothetical protein
LLASLSQREVFLPFAQWGVLLLLLLLLLLMMMMMIRVQ